MIRALLLAVFFGTGAAQAASLDGIDCPFAAETHAPTHRAQCYRFTREDAGVSVSFDIARLTPTGGPGKGAVLYIPGGPGDGPVSEDGPPPDLLAYFRDHTVLMLNPRGVPGTSPRMDCDFNAFLWQEELDREAALPALGACRAAVDQAGLSPALFNARAIADDIAEMIPALGLSQAGLYAISYGTEAALHLIADAPQWLGFAILDSVSPPGLSGYDDELAARDRFLDAVSERCFTGERCGPLTRMGYDGLADWAAQFDETPVTFSIGPDEADWSMDGADVLDFLGELSAYPDGVLVAIALVDQLASNRLGAIGFMREDIASSVDFMRPNLPLSLSAYADTYSDADLKAIAYPVRYPTDQNGWRDLLSAYATWQGNDAREAAFIPEFGPPSPLKSRVLILSGGLDTATPVPWAGALERRFSGLERFIFPTLGHAVSFGAGADTDDADIARELRCASTAVRAFVDPAVSLSDPCSLYRIGATQ